MQTNTSTLTHIADFDYYSHAVMIITSALSKASFI